MTNFCRVVHVSLILSLAAPVISAHEHEKEILFLTPEQIEEAEIETENAAPIILQITIAAPAKIMINPDLQAHVIARASGIATKLVKHVGSPVVAGEKIATLESKEVAEAKVAYMTAVKRAEFAHQLLTSEEVLRSKQISSQQEFLQTFMQAKEAEINQEMARQHLYILGLDDDDIFQLSSDKASNLCAYEIKAPLTGVVIDKNISLGEMVTDNQQIYTIADLDHVWVELALYSKDLLQIAPGKKVIIRALKGDSLSGEAYITHMHPIVNEETRVASAFARLPNSLRQWYPGAYVCADVVLDESTVNVAVLKDAVQLIDGERCLFVRSPEGFEKRVIEVGRSDNSYVEIVDGIEVGTPYAAKNAFILKAELGKSGEDQGHSH